VAIFAIAIEQLYVNLIRLTRRAGLDGCFGAKRADRRQENE
jgi:hypothetical protein